TPGHADGMVTFYNKEKNVLLSTDHILPKITPNISYWFHGNPDPLASYLHSLDEIKKLDADFVIPSHGKPFHGANERIEEIKSHHEDRLTETLEAIRQPILFMKLAGNCLKKNSPYMKCGLLSVRHSPILNTEGIEKNVAGKKRMDSGCIIKGCSKSPVKMTHRISSLACFFVAHVLIAYAVLLKATLLRTSRSFLSSFLNAF